MIVPHLAHAQFPRFPQHGGAQGAQAPIQPMPTQQALSAVAPLGPKQPGKIRIGVMLPKADMGQGFTGGDAAEPVRNSLILALSGPAIEVTPLLSRIQQQIDLEAKQKECDFLLYSSLTEKRGGSSGLGCMIRKAAPFASMIPMVGMAGAMGGVMAGAIAGQTASAAIVTASSLSTNVKATDEVTFEFKLLALGTTAPVLGNVSKAKATRNGEDVITPLIEQASSSILTEATKEKK